MTEKEVLAEFNTNQGILFLVTKDSLIVQFSRSRGTLKRLVTRWFSRLFLERLMGETLFEDMTSLSYSKGQLTMIKIKESDHKRSDLTYSLSMDRDEAAKLLKFVHKLRPELRLKA